MQCARSRFAVLALGFGMLWAGALPCVAQTPQTVSADVSTVAAELRAFEAAHEKAIDAKDVEAILGFYAPDLITVSPGQPILRGRDWIRSTMAELYRTYDFHESFTLGDIRLLGDRVAATLEYTQRMTPLAGGAPLVETGKGICILKRSAENKWQFEWNAYAADPKPTKGKE